jgi:plasmid maintenance system antidote protein VapI
VLTTREHGTYASYKLNNCRCYPCATANATYYATRERAIAYGTWQPYVDAEPVRQHIRDLLACGLGTRRIAALAGVDRKRITAVLNGRPERGTPPQTKLRPAIAAAILAVEPTLHNIASGTLVDSTGTHRRVQALVTTGWSMARIAARLGITRPNFGKVITAGQVTARTALTMRAVYDELWDAPPPEASHRDKIAASRAKNYARARGWVPPMAWDDDTIDDPASRPDLGQSASRQAALFENCEELLRQGHTIEQAAARLGVTRGYLDKVRQRAREAAA